MIFLFCYIFDNLKIIVVTRDPRSVFYSMKFRGSYAYPGYDIEKFVKWYDEIFSKQKLLQKQQKNIELSRPPSAWTTIGAPPSSLSLSLPLLD